MGKHAYLILAHKDDYTFYTLLKLIDDERNDIFVHMDRKNSRYDRKKTERYVLHSNIIHSSPRVNVSWGADSIVKAEMGLLQTATMSGTYDYYHLLSGEDLPIKPQDYIHDFFCKHAGKEFIQFQSETFHHGDRVRLFHLFQQVLGRGSGHPFLSRFNLYAIQAQKKFSICRNQGICFQKGAQWFSITDTFARYVVGQIPWINRIFHHTLCADEVFIQTILHNSRYRENLFYKYYDDNPIANMRLIDWERGTPYIFGRSDSQEIQESEMLFCRKFDCEHDREIIDYIKQMVTNVR